MPANLLTRENVPARYSQVRDLPGSYGKEMNFGENLQYLRKKSGKSRYRLWQLTGLDQSFLLRLEKGQKNPSRNSVLLLGLALVHGCSEITCDEIDELLLAASYAPLRDTKGRAPAR